MLKFWFVNTHDLYDGMPPEQRLRIAALLTERECRAGEEMAARPGGDTVYILKQGRALVMNEDVAVNVLQKGDLFGTSAFAGPSQRGEHIRALEDAVVCEAPAGPFLAEIAKHPPAAVKVVRLLSDQLASAQQQASRTATEPLPSRLANLLLLVAREGAEGMEVSGVSEGNLASMLGTARESVSRVIAGWERSGLLKRMGRRIVIGDVGVFRDGTTKT